MDQEQLQKQKHILFRTAIGIELGINSWDINFKRDFRDTSWRFMNREDGSSSWERSVNIKTDIPSLQEISEQNALPKPRTECYCLTPIVMNCLIQYLPTGRLLFVGNICVKQCGVEMVRTCVDCHQRHKCSSRRCSSCRVFCKLHGKFHEDNRYCGDKPPKRICIACGKANRAHTLYCQLCRIKCLICKTYHDSNRQCEDCRICKMSRQLDDNNLCIDCRVWCPIHQVYHYENVACGYCQDCAEPMILMNGRCTSCWSIERIRLGKIREEREKEEQREKLISRRIKFGKHKGKQYKEIDIPYLKWLFKTVEGHSWLGEFIAE